MKRAQIAVFLIVGVIVVLLVAIFFYFYAKDQGAGELPRQIVQEVPAELRPVQGFVEQCLADTAQIGLERLGERGGYIDPQRFGIYADAKATESNGVSLFSSGTMVIPYWHYLASQNGCQNQCLFSSEQPPLSGVNGEKSIERQFSV